MTGSPKLIDPAVMLYVRFVALRNNVQIMLQERSINVTHETVRFWCSSFGSMFGSAIPSWLAQQLRAYCQSECPNDRIVRIAVT